MTLRNIKRLLATYICICEVVSLWTSWRSLGPWLAESGGFESLFFVFAFLPSSISFTIMLSDNMLSPLVVAFASHTLLSSMAFLFYFIFFLFFPLHTFPWFIHLFVYAFFFSS